MQKRRIDNQLVVLAVLLDDFSQSLVVGATHISCFSAKMLRISNSTYLFIMFRASVTRIDDYWFSEAFSCRIEYVLYQCNDILPSNGREFAAASADELLFLEVFHGDFGFRWRVEGFGSYIGPRPYARLFDPDGVMQSPVGALDFSVGACPYVYGCPFKSAPVGGS